MRRIAVEMRQSTIARLALAKLISNIAREAIFEYRDGEGEGSSCMCVCVCVCACVREGALRYAANRVR